MRTNRNPFNMIKYAGKILLCALSLVIGTLVGGMFSTALQWEQPKLPSPMNLPLLGVLGLDAGIVLALALAALSPRLTGNRGIRFVMIAWFAFAWLGINNPIEACVFTTLGGGPAIAVTMLFPCLFVAAVVALLFGGREAGASMLDDVRQFFAARTTGQWTIRLSLAVLAFPIVYFLFGMPVGLMVGDYYRQQAFGLQMPSLNVVIGVQFIRSLVTLLAALPLLVAWRGSRSQWGWTFGLNLFVVSGLYGLIQAYWMPWTLRSIHGGELLLDSLAYGWLLSLLLPVGTPAGHPEPAEAVGMREYKM